MTDKQEKSMVTKSSLIIAISVLLLGLGGAIFFFMTPRPADSSRPAQVQVQPNAVPAPTTAAPKGAVKPETGKMPPLMLIILAVVIAVMVQVIRLVIKDKFPKPF
jgi:hypothetical protein